MPVIDLVILFATGLGIGFLSGFLGIGGGIIMIPVQYWLYTSGGMSPDLAIKISFATSLAVILPTATSGVLKHHRLGNINWRAGLFIGIFGAVTSFIGASIASHISATILKIIFGAILILIAIRMLTIKISDEEGPINENRWLWSGIGLGAGLISGFIGLGGGVFVIPALVLLLGFRIHNATATSLAIVFLISVGGIAGYIVNGLNVPGLPDHTFGYFYWPAWIAMVAGSIGTAQLGANAAHKAPARLINLILVILLVYIGLDMLGVTAWVAGKI